MLTEKEIEKLIRLKIEKDENLGERSGGSGHLGFVSYTLDEIRIIKQTGTVTEAQYDYTLFIETEFTVYPDNPPAEYPKKGMIIFDAEKGTINGAGNE